MKLVAAVTLNHSIMMQMEKDEIEDYVLCSLAREISNEVTKHMSIEETKDPINDTTRYSGTITLGTNHNHPMYGAIISSTRINSAIISGGSSMIKKNEELRVAEYVSKNGNITRVELQRLQEDGWSTIPRVKIEEL
jgi:hypothetical protein